MNQPPKQKKRIVSKGQYVASWGSRLSLAAWGNFLYAIAIFCALVSTGRLIALITSLYEASRGKWAAGDIALELTGFVIFGMVFHFFRTQGQRAMKKAKNLDAGVPLTRANTASLPAGESLVRASEEPLHEQQAVLLRPAENQAAPAENLVTPAREPEP